METFFGRQTARLAAGALALFAIGCGAGSATSTGSGGSKDPVEVGMAIAQTGYLAANDAPINDGATLAAKHINDAGGADGRKLNLHVVDMASTAATAVTVTNQLLNQYNVGVMINGASSASTAAEAPINGQHGVPMIVASIVAPDPKWTFSTLQPVDKYVEIELGYAQKVAKATNVAVFYSQTPYGQLAGTAMAAKASSYGIKISTQLGIDTNSTDLTPQVQKARDAGAEAILDILTGPVHLVLAKNAAGLGLKIPIVMATDDTTTFTPAAASYPISFFLLRPPQLYPAVKDAKIKAADDAFVAEYKKAYGSKPGIADAGRGWDAVQMLAKAVAASHSNTGEPLRAALEKVVFAGTGTEFQFTPSDHTGQLAVPNPLVIGQYQGGSFKSVYTVG